MRKLCLVVSKLLKHSVKIFCYLVRVFNLTVFDLKSGIINPFVAVLSNNNIINYY